MAGTTDLTQNLQSYECQSVGNGTVQLNALDNLSPTSIADGALAYVVNSDESYRWYPTSVTAPGAGVVVPVGIVPPAPGRWILQTAAVPPGTKYQFITGVPMSTTLVPVNGAPQAPAQAPTLNFQNLYTSGTALVTTVTAYNQQVVYLDDIASASEVVENQRARIRIWQRDTLGPVGQVAAVSDDGANNETVISLYHQAYQEVEYASTQYHSPILKFVGSPVSVADDGTTTTVTISGAVATAGWDEVLAINNQTDGHDPTVNGADTLYITNGATLQLNQSGKAEFLGGANLRFVSNPSNQIQFYGTTSADAATLIYYGTGSAPGGSPFTLKAPNGAGGGGGASVEAFSGSGGPGGGALTLSAGDGGVAGGGGDINLNAGDSNGAAAGGIIFTGGSGLTGGGFTFNGGAGISGGGFAFTGVASSASATFTLGAGTGSGNGGSFTVATGASGGAGGVGGNIVFLAGSGVATGGGFTLTAGAGNATGGGVSITSGIGGATGGSILITAEGGGTSGGNIDFLINSSGTNQGDFSFVGGAGPADSSAFTVDLGGSCGGVAGNFTVLGASGTTNGSSFVFNLGGSTAGTAGSFVVNGQSSTGSGSAILLTAGNTNGGTAGPVTLTAGNGGGGSAGANVTLNSGAGTGPAGKLTVLGGGKVAPGVFGHVRIDPWLFLPSGIAPPDTPVGGGYLYAIVASGAATLYWKNDLGVSIQVS